MNTILLVDGSNLLFQMFFGMPSRIYNSDGIGIWGVIGFIGAILKMIRKYTPVGVVVLFDGDIHVNRKDIDSKYKTNRIDFSDVPEDENPYSQLKYIYSALDYLGIRYSETVDCEVDDWIASYVKILENDNKILISSYDSDFFQLLNDNVSIIRYRGDNTVIFTTDTLFDKYKVMPHQYAGFKSLVGDKADNIEGVKGIGIKTAAKLMAEFDNLDNMIAFSDRIKNKRISELITKNLDRIKKNYSIIKLDGKNEIPYKMNQILYVYKGITTTEVLCGIGLK